MRELSLKHCNFILSHGSKNDNSSLSDVLIKGFCVDTNLLIPGQLFFALSGNKTDGHYYLEKAASLGAIAAVVKSSYTGPDYNLPLIRVDDPLMSLQLLTKNLIAKSHAKIIAITGSVGKTTTKDFITTLLRKKFKVCSTHGNQNSQIGMPLSILNHTSGDEDILVLEMSLSEKGQIAKLVDIAPPDLAVLTTVALVHANSFNSLEEIALAKAEIFNHPKTTFGILDHEIEHLHSISRLSRCDKTTFSTIFEGADYFLREFQDKIRISGRNTEDFDITPLQIAGKHNRHNFLAAVVVARHLGLTWEEIELNSKNLVLPEKRFELSEKNGVVFINDSYNASEISVKAALESLPHPKGNGRRIAILGEMLELGGFSDECHRSVGKHALEFVDEMICFGDLCQPMQEIWLDAGKPFFISSNWNMIVEQTKRTLRENDVVLLKGSRAKGIWKILDEY